MIRRAGAEASKLKRSREYVTKLRELAMPGEQGDKAKAVQNVIDDLEESFAKLHEPGLSSRAIKHVSE